MKSNKTLVKALGSVLIGGLLIGGVAFAGDIKTNVKNHNGLTEFKLANKDKSKMCPNRGFNNQKKQEMFQQSLHQLLKAGTLDQKKVNEIKAYIDKKNKVKEKHGSNIIKELVKNKIITQDQANQFRNKLQENAQVQQQQRFTQVVKDLVAKKTISQDQGDKIVKEFEAFHKERKVIMDKIKGMTKAERQAFFKSKKKEFKNPLNRLVENKVITKQQAIDIKKTLKLDQGIRKGIHKGFHKDFNKQFNKDHKSF